MRSPHGETSRRVRPSPISLQSREGSGRRYGFGQVSGTVTILDGTEERPPLSLGRDAISSDVLSFKILRERSERPSAQDQQFRGSHLEKQTKGSEFLRSPLSFSNFRSLIELNYDLPESVRRASSRSRKRVMSNPEARLRGRTSRASLKAKHRTLQQQPVRALLRWPALPAHHSRLSRRYL